MKTICVPALKGRNGKFQQVNAREGSKEFLISHFQCLNHLTSIPGASLLRRLPLAVAFCAFGAETQQMLFKIDHD